jgi:uncharacterized protein (TIGR02300 family)
LDVTKPELGTKRRCNSCETKFFDLNKDPIVCPECMAVFAPPQPDAVRPRRVPDRRPSPAEKVTTPNVPKEFVSLEGANADTETEAPTADAKEVDGGLNLLEDQDENLDATDTIGADFEKDDI